MTLANPLEESEVLVLSADWEGEVAPPSEADVLFVVQLREGRPAVLSKLEDLEEPVGTVEVREAGEELQPAQVSLPEEGVIEFHFARHGAVLKGREQHFFLPAEGAFESREDVISTLSAPGYSLLAALEALPGESGDVEDDSQGGVERESRECPGGPLPHRVRVRRGDKTCPQHPDVETEAI